MCKVKDGLLEKIYKQIEEKKSSMGEATLHQFDDGSAIVNFFDTWEDSIAEGAKKLSINKIGDYLDDKDLQMVFSKKGTHVPLHDFEAKKTYVVIRGEIDFFYENGNNIKVTDFSSIIVPKGVLHGGTTMKDTFVLVIEDQCECDLPLS